jgi:hypothetical protein
LQAVAEIIASDSTPDAALAGLRAAYTRIVEASLGLGVVVSTSGTGRKRPIVNPLRDRFRRSAFSRCRSPSATLTVSANPSTTSRSGFVVVAGDVVTVTQAALIVTGTQRGVATVVEPIAAVDRPTPTATDPLPARAPG